MKILSLFQSQIRKTLSIYSFSSNFVECIQKPNQTILFDVPVILSDGKLKIFEGYRVQHNNWLGPYKGGLRFSEHVDIEECKALAFWMTIKCALHHLPLGGGKGGLKYNPRHYSEEDNRRICESFSICLSHFIGPQKDIPAPDIGSTSQMMDWMTCAYQKSTNSPHIFGVYTGKSLSFRGSEARLYSTGLGMVYCLQYWFEHHFQESLKNKTFVLQGFGNVGSWTFHILNSLGMKCLAIADHTGYYSILPHNISFENIISYNNTHKSLQDIELQFPNAIQKLNPLDFWSIPCDVVIPAALELQIQEKEADVLQCKVVLEGANGGISQEGEDILLKKNIEIIPDVLCNSGGVIVSYFEWLQNNQNEQWSKDKVETQLKSIMDNTCSKVFQLKTNNDNRVYVYKIAFDILQHYYSLKNPSVSNT